MTSGRASAWVRRSRSPPLPFGGRPRQLPHLLNPSPPRTSSPGGWPSRFRHRRGATKGGKEEGPLPGSVLEREQILGKLACSESAPLPFSWVSGWLMKNRCGVRGDSNLGRSGHPPQSHSLRTTPNAFSDDCHAGHGSPARRRGRAQVGPVNCPAGRKRGPPIDPRRGRSSTGERGWRRRGGSEAGYPPSHHA